MLKLILSAVAIASGEGLPVKTPMSVGMSAERLQAVDRVIRRGIAAGGYPGAAVVVGRRGAVALQKGYGRAGWDPKSAPVSVDRTIYDLASVSKVVGTTMAAMILYDEGRLSLDAPVAAYVPEFSGGAKDAVTIRQLLTHRSGLPAGRDIWRIARSREQAEAALVATPLTAAPGSRYIYSDLGAHLLAMAIERVAGVQLDEFLALRVFVPLGMSDTYYRPHDSLRLRIAPTEMTPPRGYPLRGEVHDENAYALEGVAGHAGLFSTAQDLSIFAQMLLNGGTYNGTRIVSDSTVALFTRHQAGSRALGWETAAGGIGSGRHLSPRAYGHTGYTGTSIWIDPDREMFVILLTNRVHAPRARRPAKVISDIRNDLSDAAALAVVDYGPGPLAMPAAFRADRAVGWDRPPVSSTRSSRAKRSASSRRVSSGRRSVSASRSSRSKKPAVRKGSTSTAKRSTKAAPAKRSPTRAAKSSATRGRSSATRS